MTNSLLRSGCPDDFLPLGENGQAVFDSAHQIRETLRLRKQQAVADALAIPQINDSGDRVDWYAPNPGHVTSWAAASDEQRTAALRYLEHCQASVKLLSSQCLRSEKTALRLFGSLLAKALHFPASQYIYLVADKPVITFWGFVKQNETAPEDILACLRVRETRALEPIARKEKARAPVVVPAATPRASDIAAVYAQESEPEPATEPPAAPAAMTEIPQPQRRWRPTLAAVAVLIAVASAYYFLPSRSSQSEVTPAAIAETVTSPVIEPPQPVMDIPPTTLPLVLATVTPPVVKAPEPVAPVVKGALVLPADEVKSGSTKFLNGTWQARIKSSDPATDKLSTLRYRIVNNKGTVRLLNGSNVTCKAEMYAGLHQSGTLMIKHRGSARCTDGTRQILPEIACKAGANGVAECTGRYTDDNLQPITFQKVSN